MRGWDQALSLPPPHLAEEARSQLRVLCFRIQFVVIAAPRAGQRSFVRPWSVGFCSCLLYSSLCLRRRLRTLLFPLSPSSDTRSPSPFHRLSSTVVVLYRSAPRGDRCTRQPKHATASVARTTRLWRKENERIASSLTHLPPRQVSHTPRVGEGVASEEWVSSGVGDGVLSRIAGWSELAGVDNLRIYYCQATGTYAYRGEWKKGTRNF